MNFLNSNKLFKMLIIVLYVIILMIMIRNHVGLLKIQTDWYRDDTEWKYHEWENPSIEVSGVSWPVYEGYPQYEYTTIKYVPGEKYEPIVITNPSWSEWDKESCDIYISLGNTVIYQDILPIVNDTITIENLSDTWKNAEKIYYAYHFFLFILLALGFAAGVLIIWQYYKNLAEGCHRILTWLSDRKKKLIPTAVICLLYLIGCLLWLQNSNYLIGELVFLPRLELCVYIGAVLLVFGISLYSLKSWRHALLITCIAAIPLFFSLHDVTLFQSKDEMNNIKEQLWFSQDTLRHWSFGNARTNYLIMGTIWKLIPEKYALVGIEPVHLNAFQFSKVIHWMCGFVISMIMIVHIHCRIIKPQNMMHKEVSLLLLLVGVFTLPVWNMGMCNYNYDLFSMLFCVFGFFLCMDYLLTGQERCKWLSLLVMGLALQEKEFVIVYLLLVMVAFLAYDMIWKYSKRKTDIFLDSLLIYLLPFLPLAITDVWVLSALRGGRNSMESFSRTVLIFTKCMEMIIHKLQIVLNSYETWILTYMVIVIAGIIAAMAGKFLIRKLAERNRSVILISVLLFVFFLLNAVAAVYMGYAAGLDVERGGDVVRIFMENTYGYGSFVPTVYLLSGLLLAVYLAVFKKSIRLSNWEKLTGVLAATILGGVTWCNIIAGCFQDRRILTGRYQNIQQLLNMFSIIILVVIFVKNYRAIVAALIGVGAFLETIWSAPGYTVFYPIWNRSIYSEDYMLYDDWGVGNGLAGEMIEDYCIENNIPFEGANMYSSNYTEWGDNNYGISLQPMKTAVLNKQCEWDENDFYVVFSNSILENNVQFVIPDDVVPAMTIKYRGVERIWIYQGGQVKDCYPFTEW